MPFNFLWAGLIHLALPRAVIIHCRRTALDTALSIHQTHFHPSLAFPTGGASWWRISAATSGSPTIWRRVLPADRFIEVDYEELTRAPDPGIRRIIAACGLSWHDACLHPEKNPRSVKTPSKCRPGSRSIAPRSNGGGATNPGWGRCAHCATRSR